MSKRFVIWSVIAAFIGTLLTAILVSYVALVMEGKLPTPDPAAVLSSVSNLIGVATVGAGTVLALALLTVAFLAAIAPIVYAVRSADRMTFLISLVLVIVTWAIVFNSRTSIDLALAGIVYLASMTLSAVVFAAERINRTIPSNQPATRAP